MHYLTLDNFLKVLFLLMPLTFIIGPAVININIFLLFITYFLIFFFKKKINYSYLIKDKLFLFFCIFFSYIILLSLISNDIIFSLKSSLSFIKFLFIFLAYKYLLSNNILSFKFTIVVYALVIIYVVIDGVFQITFGSNLKPEYGQFSGVFDDKHILGSYLSRTIFLLAIFLILFKIKNQKIYFIILFLLLSGTFISILFSGERTAFLNLFLFLLLVIIFKVFKLNLISLIVSIAFILLSAVFIINNNYLYDRYVQTNLDQFKKFEKLSMPLPDHYYLHYLTAYKIFKDYPIIGIGPNMYRKYCNKDSYLTQAGDMQEIPEMIPFTENITPEEIDLNAKISRLKTLDGCSTHPHHMHIQILSELGLIGYLFFILFLIYIIFNFFKNRPITNIDKLLLIGIFINFFPFLPSGNIFGSYFNFLLFLPILFYLNRKYL